jgi:hypothetical protein
MKPKKEGNIRTGRLLTAREISLEDLVIFDKDVFEDDPQYAHNGLAYATIDTVEDLELANESSYYDAPLDAGILTKLGFEDLGNGIFTMRSFHTRNKIDEDGNLVSQDKGKALYVSIDTVVPDASVVEWNWAERHDNGSESPRRRRYEGEVESVRHLQHIMREVGVRNYAGIFIHKMIEKK